MMNLRCALRDGDRTSNNGMLMGTGEMTHHGARVGVEGDFATCPVCKSGGTVTNDCYPAFSLMDKQILVEGACVNCKCAVKPIVIASLNTFTIQVNRGGHTHLRADSAAAAPVEASNKLVAGVPRETSENAPTLICQNMSNAEFYATMNRLRDKAVRLLADRLVELDRWNRADQDKVRLWFGNAREDTRETLRDGLARMREIMHGLTDRNYERQTKEALARVGCVPRAKGDEIPAAASICKPDGTYSIFIGHLFCTMPDEANRNNVTPSANDSKLTTLIHEVSHFPSAMNTEDSWSNIKWAQKQAARDKFCLNNADSIAAYVANIPNWDGLTPVWRP
ncbi:M35 family metallo-endopeptidase [Cupriavidus basilensis]|uniref:M35 family metallo-endopeptidase n=1 Tax=Cupriavidus basilensis TaxID=68895 RepID=UPI00157B1C6C|nr:M35 family metallo-endopeptidase [Cupriavidus basilensis]